MKKITKNELVEMLTNIKGVTFANITYKVDESKSKTVNKKKLLQKEVTVNVTINANYKRKINKILETKQNSDPVFESKIMNGKTYSFKNCKCIVENMNGKTYSFKNCKCIVENMNGTKMLYCFIENKAKRLTTYFHEQCVITKEKAIKKGFFTPAFFNKSNTVGRNSIDKENDFSVITPALSHIKRIKIMKEEYFIID